MSLTEEMEFDKQGEAIRYPLLRKLFLSFVIILVAALSFGIGRLTGQGSEPIRIEYDATIASPENQSASAIKSLPLSGVVASKSGQKYHYAHCPGAKQIKPENKITFTSATAAEASGYTLASNCSPR